MTFRKKTAKPQTLIILLSSFRVQPSHRNLMQLNLINTTQSLLFFFFCENLDYHVITDLKSVTCIRRWTLPNDTRSRKQEDWTRSAAGPPPYPSLEWRQSVLVIPAQAGRSPCGNAPSVCEEGKAVQSSSLGSNRWKWLETHPDHIMGHRPGKCKYNNKYKKIMSLS